MRRRSTSNERCYLQLTSSCFFQCLRLFVSMPICTSLLPITSSSHDFARRAATSVRSFALALALLTVSNQHNMRNDELRILEEAIRHKYTYQNQLMLSSPHRLSPSQPQPQQAQAQQQAPEPKSPAPHDGNVILSSIFTPPPPPAPPLSRQPAWKPAPLPAFATSATSSDGDGATGYDSSSGEEEVLEEG